MNAIKQSPQIALLTLFNEYQEKTKPIKEKIPESILCELDHEYKLFQSYHERWKEYANKYNKRNPKTPVDFRLFWAAVVIDICEDYYGIEINPNSTFKHYTPRPNDAAIKLI